MTPPGKWLYWLLLAGRGFGKTKTGAEDVAHFGLRNPDARIAIVVPTFTDGRDVCIEGESGLLNCLPAKNVADWNRSIGELFLTNRSSYRIYTAEKPDRLRGPQHHRAWCDELASWRYGPETWSMLQLGLRLGKDTRTIITTTPRPVKLLRDIIKDPDTYLTRGTTFENRENLSENFFKEVSKYEGTRLGEQELYAKVLDDVPGSLWQRSLIDQTRLPVANFNEILKKCRRVVVGVDPAVTSTEDADETGIIVAGIDENNEGYVFADKSRRDSPQGWASAAIRAFKDLGCDRIIGEVNNGGDLVENTLRQVDANIPFTKVSASRGKYVRAEPISALYEQHRIHHVGTFEELEDQMCMFTPENIAKNSPDRAEGLVWAFTELFSGILNLGLLAFQKEEQALAATATKEERLGNEMDKIARMRGVAKPATSSLSAVCPKCSSKAVVLIGKNLHCNQCGEDTGPELVVSKNFSRTDVAGRLNARN